MARRGENIHKRKDGRWEGRYIKSRTSDKKVVWGYVYGGTYADVKQVLIRKKAEYGFYKFTNTELTFAEFSEIWLQTIKHSVKEFHLCALPVYTGTIFTPRFGAAFDFHP